MVVWVNHSEHLTIRSLEKRGNVRAAVSRLQSFVSILQKQLKFSKHEKLGYLTLKPQYIGISQTVCRIIKLIINISGTGLRVRITVDLPKLANNMKSLRNLCIKYDINISKQEQYSFTLTSSSSLGQSEFQIIAKFFTGIKEILEFE